MKKVWVLEKWQTPEEMNKQIKFLENVIELAKYVGNQETVAKAESVIKEMEESPEGRWFGRIRESNYRKFCKLAKEELRRTDGKVQFRVVEAEIDGKAIRVNERVMSYLKEKRGQENDIGRTVKNA